MDTNTYKWRTIADFLNMRRISDGIHRCAFCEHAYSRGLDMRRTIYPDHPLYPGDFIINETVDHHRILCAVPCDRRKNHRNDGTAKLYWEDIGFIPLSGKVREKKWKLYTDHPCPFCELNNIQEKYVTKTEVRGKIEYITECPNFEPIKNYGEIYYFYLKTDEWKHKAAAIKERDRYKCKLCGSGINIVVHHTSYDHVGCERDDELVTVCQHCHEHIHSEDINRKE